MPAADERLENYARLAVQVGLNLQPGQTLGINALIEHAPLVRAIARQAYAAGARYVDVLYSDQHVRRAHIAGAADDQLGFSPPWLVQRLTSFGEHGGALCAITGNPEPELFADLDGERVGKARMKEVAEASLKLTDGLCNWTIVAFPNEGWAQTVFGEPDVERLWRRWPRRCGSTRTIPSPPGATTSRGCSSARRRSTRGASTTCATAAPAPT